MTHIYVIYDPHRKAFYAGPKSFSAKEWVPHVHKAKWYKRSGDASNAISYEMGYNSPDARFVVGREYEVVTYRLEWMYESAKKILKKG